MAAICDVLPKIRPLVDKVGLIEKILLAAAASGGWSAFEVLTLSQETASFRPKTMLLKNHFHTLEPLGVLRVIFREVEGLR